jgi:hypothetical protein
MTGGKNPRDWQKSDSSKKLSKQSLFDRQNEKHNRSVEVFIKKYEKKIGKNIERDWND